MAASTLGARSSSSGLPNPRRQRGVTRWRQRVAMAGAWLTIGWATIGLASCTDASTPEPTAADYTSQLVAVCAATAAQLDALPDPPEGITVAEFATQASAILTGEAEQVRALAVPDDLDDDHRALIGNDEDQAAAWTRLAAAPAGDATTLSELTTAIASLNLGRNDLVTEMGAPGCARSPG